MVTRFATFGGATELLRPDDPHHSPRPDLDPLSDLISTWIWPNFDPKSPQEVRIGSNLCCLYARIDCAQCRSRMEWTSSADVCAMTLDNAIAAVSLLHACPWSLEPSRAVVNIHMLSIHRSRLQCCTPWHSSFESMRCVYSHRKIKTWRT